MFLMISASSLGSPMTPVNSWRDLELWGRTCNSPQKSATCDLNEDHPAVRAIKTQNFEKLQSLVKENSLLLNSNFKIKYLGSEYRENDDTDLLTLLYIAVIDHATEIAKYLLKNSAADKKAFSAAVMSGAFDLVKLFCEDPKYKDLIFVVAKTLINNDSNYQPCFSEGLKVLFVYMSTYNIEQLIKTVTDSCQSAASAKKKVFERSIELMNFLLSEKYREDLLEDALEETKKQDDILRAALNELAQ